MAYFLLLAVAPALVAAWSPVGALPMAQSVGRTSVVRCAAPDQNPKWSEPILDESLPDPVFDDTYEYKGVSKIGFTTFAEVLNSRASMMGFTIAFLQEAITGKGVFEFYGLPCTRRSRARQRRARPPPRAIPCARRPPIAARPLAAPLC